MTTPQQSLKLFSTIAMRNVLKAIIPEFEKRSDAHVTIEYGATAQLSERIRAGERADAIMAVSSSIEELMNEGILQPGSRLDFVSSDVAMAVKQGAPAPDISTAEAFKATLLSCRSVCFSKQGASGMYFASLLKKLGIEDEVRAKALVLPEGLTGEPVARGEIELAVQQMSELMQVSGIDIFAKLPPAVQQSTIFSLASFAETKQAKVIQSLATFMHSPEVSAALRSQGLGPLL